LKESINYINIPIININSQANFVCNKAYIKEIYFNSKNNKKFELFEKLCKIENQLLNKYDNENIIKFIFSIQNLDFSYSDKNIQTNIENFVMQNDPDLYDNKSINNKISKLKQTIKNFKRTDSIFKLNGYNTRENLINLYHEYIKIIEHKLQDLSKEISFYHLITNKKNRIIKKNFHILMDKIEKINAEFIAKLSFLIKKFTLENQIDQKEFFKLGEIKTINNIRAKGISTDHIKEENIIYDLFIRYNSMNDSLDFTLKNKKESKIIKNSVLYDIKDDSFLNKVFPRLIKKICHEIRNPLINILQLVKDIKTGYNKKTLAFSNDENKNQKNSIIKEHNKEGNKENSYVINSNSNPNSLRLNSFDNTLTEKTVNFSFNPLCNDITDYINQTYKINIDDLKSSNKNLNIDVSSDDDNNKINNNKFNSNNIENSINGAVNINCCNISNNSIKSNRNITSKDNLILFNSLTFDELHHNFQKIKCFSKMINLTINEFEFLQEV